MSKTYENKKRAKKTFNPDSKMISKAVEEFLKNGGSIEKQAYTPSYYESTDRYESVKSHHVFNLLS